MQVPDETHFFENFEMSMKIMENWVTNTILATIGSRLNPQNVSVKLIRAEHEEKKKERR